jgi:hypothetical protein
MRKPIIPRIPQVIVALGLLVIAGCSQTEELAKAKGPLFALNPDHWQATPQDLAAPPANPNK